MTSSLSNSATSNMHSCNKITVFPAHGRETGGSNATCSCIKYSKQCKNITSSNFNKLMNTTTAFKLTCGQAVSTTALDMGDCSFKSWPAF
jgi:hypothetical protein